MLPVSAAELASIRTDVAVAACDQPCVIQRPTTTKTPSGMDYASGYTVVSPVGLLAGLRPPTAGQLQMYASRLGSLALWQVQLPYGTDVKVNDQVLIGGKTMTVQVDYSPQSYNMLTTVLASAVLP